MGNKNKKLNSEDKLYNDLLKEAVTDPSKKEDDNEDLEIIIGLVIINTLLLLIFCN